MAGKDHRRGPWSPEEDQYLLTLVKTHGATNWVKISNLVSSRTPKQCRERFHQNLKPSLNTEPISQEEGAQIEKLVNEMGKRWAEIARRLHNRSDNAVKNWWNGGVNRRKRRDHRRSDMAAPSSQRAAHQQQQQQHQQQQQQQQQHHQYQHHQVPVQHIYPPQPGLVSSQYDPRVYSQEDGLVYQQQPQHHQGPDAQLPPLHQQQQQQHQQGAYLHPPMQYHHQQNPNTQHHPHHQQQQQQQHQQQHRQGPGDTLLPSPATDQFPSSHRTSMEAAPSLISDHGSSGSYYSPASPSHDLQPVYPHPSYHQTRDSYVRSSMNAYSTYPQYTNPAVQVSSYSNNGFEKSPTTYLVPQANLQDSSYAHPQGTRHHQSSYSTPRIVQDQSSYAEAVQQYHDAQHQQQPHHPASSYSHGHRMSSKAQRDLPDFKPPSCQGQLPAVEPKLATHSSSPPKDGRMGLHRIVN